MIMVKVLERKEVIRLFGLALVLSPLFNNITSLLLLPESPNKWTLGFFWKVVAKGAWTDHSLALCGLLIGAVMLRGASSAWKFALILLGGHILNQLAHFGENLRISWAYGLFFVLNVIVFLFIADQLVWKQTPKAAALPEQKSPTPAPRPAPTIAATVSTPKKNLSAPPPQPRASATEPPRREIPTRPRKVLIQFEGLGIWAQLMAISGQGLHLRGLTQAPDAIDSREIELQLRDGLSLKLRLARHANQDYFFEFIEINSKDIKLLNQWIQKLAA